jgi:predicted Zn-dependent protease
MRPRFTRTGAFMRPQFVPLLLGLSLFVLPRPAEAQFYGDLARTNALTAADDYRIGKSYIDGMSWLWGTVDDPALQTRIEALVRRIGEASDRPDIIFNVTILDTDEVNAAALPGGFLLINKGLIDGMPEDQLAFVLAHEISHVQLRHFATTMNMNRALAVMGVAEAARVGEDRSAATNAYEEMAKMARAYAKDLELEADLYGMLYAMRAGWPAKSGPDAMATMRTLVGEVMPHEADVSDHPSFADRIVQLNLGMTTIQETYALFDAGVSYSRSGAPEAAVGAFQQFLTIFPKSAAAWSNLGTVWLQKAIRSFPDDPLHDDLPLYSRADVTVRAADTAAMERARAAFKKALAIDPNRDAALGNLGALARIEGDLDGAEALLLQAIELDPKYAGYRSNLANVYASKKRWKKAEKGYAKARALDKNADYVRGNQAALFGLRGKTKDAVKAWRALESVPSQAMRAHSALVALGEKPDDAPVPVAPAPTDEDLAGLLVLLGSLTPEGDGGDTLTAEPVTELKPLPEATPAPPERKAGDADVGTLELGASVAEVTTVLGEPEHTDDQEDGYYAYRSWTSRGVEVVFIDDAAANFQVSPPCEMRTGRGLALGVQRSAVISTYGEPEYSFGDPSLGYEALMYESIGHALYLGEGGALIGFGVWEL